VELDDAENMRMHIEDDLMREEEEIDDVELEEMLRMQNMKFNIIFTVGGEGGYYGDEEGLSSSDEEPEEKEDKETFTKGEKINVKLKDWDKFYSGNIKKVRKNGNYDITLDDETYDTQSDIRPKFIKSITKEESFNALLEEMEALSKTRKKKGKTAMMKHLQELSQAAQKKNDKEKKKRDKEEQAKNVGKLRRLLREKNVMNDFKYFAKMPLETQKNILSKLKEVNEYYSVEKPYRISLLESDIPVAFKSQALKKINTLSYMDPGSGEYYKIKQWVDTFMNIPFGKHQQLPIKLSDGKEKCGEFMENAKKILDECVYGLEDAKMQILQYIGQWISNPETTGTAIAIKGPPGTGKTTLIKEGISKILSRPFAFMALGGATDSSFLEGHSYTYEGSTWGKIVDILIQSKYMNPVIFMDELDKISATPKGEEIVGILTHLTDTTQNDKFHDKYFANVDFNLSKALFIFSYNDESKVNPILKDRMYRIHTDGYKNVQKLTIAKQYLIPKIEKNVNFEKDNLIIPDDTLTYIMENYTENEKGVRNLKRCLEIIYTKINLYRLMKPDSSLFNKESSLNVTFPFTITNQIVGKLIKKGEDNSTPFGMYM
jgi:ATP-dependent Lon protease